MKRVSMRSGNAKAALVLALGGLLTLAGLYALATGLPIIEIERGWAMVIAGAVLLSGGLVVAALGIVVGTLVELIAGLGAVRSEGVETDVRAPAMVEPVAPTPGLPELTDTRQSAAELPSAPEMPPLPSRKTMSTPLLRDDDKTEAIPAPFAALSDLNPAPALPRVAAFEPRSDARHADRTLPEQASPDHDAYEVESPKTGSRGQTFSAFDLEPEPVPPPPNEAIVADDTMEPAPGASVRSNQHAAHDTHQVSVETASEQREASLELDHQSSTQDPHRIGESPDEPVSHTGELRDDLAPPTTLDPTSSHLTVIGRYDSDGTSYVMYSDGSIEALTEGRVVRFGSMAELKAYIEG